jgi:hypothetical protein
MECRISYFRLLLPIIIINLVGLPLTLLFGASPLTEVPLLLLCDIVIILLWFLKPPLVWMLVDQQTETFSYQSLLTKVITVKLSTIRSQLITRQTSSSGLITEFLLYQGGNRIATLRIDDWPSNQLETLNTVLNKKAR